MNENETPTAPPIVERCARCGCMVAAWRVDRDGRTFCTSYCASVSPSVPPPPDEDPGCPAPFGQEFEQ